MTTMAPRVAMGSRANEDLVCKAFQSNIFKPEYCSHCYRARASHAASTMPLQNMSNGQRHRTGAAERGSDNLGLDTDEVWIRKGSPGPNPRHQRPTAAGSKSQNGHQSPRIDSGRKRAVDRQAEKLVTQGIPRKPAVHQNGAPKNGIEPANRGVLKGSHDPNLYEPIFPTDENIENFDNQANTVLEGAHAVKQRSYSDVRAHPCLQDPDISRRVSTPLSTMGKSRPHGDSSTSSDIFEFQRLAGRLKHSNRKDVMEATPSRDARVHVPLSAQGKIPRAQYGYAQVNKIGAKRTGGKPNPHDRSQSANNLSTNVQARTGGNNLMNDARTKGKSDTMSSSRSLGELSSSPRSQSSVSNEEVAPAVPVRSDSMKKNASGGPGFALECLVPDRITIISADGSREVVSPHGRPPVTTVATPNEAEASTDKATPVPQSKKSRAVVRSKSSPQIPLPNDLASAPTSNPNIPDNPSKPHPEAVPYEIMKVGHVKQNDYKVFGKNQLATRPLPECPGNREVTNGLTPGCGEKPGTGSRSMSSEKGHSTGSPVPPFPVILHNDQDHKLRNRHSGNYKVPIFIKHQDYDNLGTVRADQDYEAMQLGTQSGDGAEVAPKPDVATEVQEDQYYLQPDGSNKFPAKAGSSVAEQPVKEDEYEVVGHSKDGIEPASQSDQKIGADATPEKMGPKKTPAKPPRRSRSQTHPISCQEVHQASSGDPSSAQSTPDTASRMKRAAPRAPGFSREDTMPRMPPPPPPSDESRRLSKDLQEGILRYHRAAGVATNPLKGQHSPTQDLGGPSTQKPETKPIPESVSPEREGDVDAEPLVHENKSKGVSTPKGGKGKTTPNLAVSPHKGRSAPQPMISPPKTHLLHHLGESPRSHTTANESRQKEKKSLMFWRKRRRKEDGRSPEREYNTDIVTQWLERLRQSPPLTTRRSWERMEVINAYKGQETAVIGCSSPQDSSSPDTGSAKRRAPKPPDGVARSDSMSSAQSLGNGDGKPPSDKDKARDGERGVAERGVLATQQGVGGEKARGVEGCPMKPPPRTRSQRRRRSNTVHDIPEYVNIAYLQQNKIPPAKPHRRVRGTRSLTTGFENIPSATKRLAPKNPEEEAVRKLSTSVLPLSASDLALSSQGSGDAPDPQPHLKSAPDPQSPLKSALKRVSPEGEDDKTRNGDKPPRRPVRVIPSDEDPLEVSSSQYGLPKSGYVNLEVKQVDVDSFSGEDAEAPTSPPCRDADLVLDQVQSMQRQVLLRVGALYPQPVLEKATFQNRTWSDFTLHERTVMFSDERTFCFRAQLKENEQECCLMVFLHEHQLDRIFEASLELESCPAHPNVLNIVHTFRATLPAHLFNNNQDEASQSNTWDSPCGQSEAVVVVTSQVPTSTATLFLEESAHRDRPEEYKGDVWCLVLQVCRGVVHAQRQEPKLSLEGLKQESVLRMGAGSNLWLFNPLVVSTLATPSTGRRDSVVSHLTDKCCEFDLGILIYELLAQPNPFAVRTSLMSRNYTPDDLPSLPGSSPHNHRLTALVRECLRRCPEERTNMDDALWMASAMTFCPSLVSVSGEDNNNLDLSGLNQLILLKQTELVCGLAGPTSSPRESTIWEKLEYLFWGEVDTAKLQRVLQNLKK